MPALRSRWRGECSTAPAASSVSTTSSTRCATTSAPGDHHVSHREVLVDHPHALDRVDDQQRVPGHLAQRAQVGATAGGVVHRADHHAGTPPPGVRRGRAKAAWNSPADVEGLNTTWSRRTPSRAAARRRHSPSAVINASTVPPSAPASAAYACEAAAATAADTGPTRAWSR